MNTRAQPVVAAPDVSIDLKMDSGEPASRASLVSYLLRMHPGLKRIIADSAEREGLSINAWCIRVLAEHAKLSKDGWRSIPSTDAPRPKGNGGFVTPVTQPGTITRMPNPMPYTVISPNAISGSGTFTTTTGVSNPVNVTSSQPTYWTAPDDDIPEL